MEEFWEVTGVDIVYFVVPTGVEMMAAFVVATGVEIVDFFGSTFIAY